jgi:hypothetical protein
LCGEATPGVTSRAFVTDQLVVFVCGSAGTLKSTTARRFPPESGESRRVPEVVQGAIAVLWHGSVALDEPQKAKASLLPSGEKRGVSAETGVLLLPVLLPQPGMVMAVSVGFRTVLVLRR